MKLMRSLRNANFTLVGTSRRGLRLMTWKHCTRRFMLPFVLILPWQNQPRNLRRSTRGIISRSVEHRCVGRDGRCQVRADIVLREPSLFVVFSILQCMMNYIVEVSKCIQDCRKLITPSVEDGHSPSELVSINYIPFTIGWDPWKHEELVRNVFQCTRTHNSLSFSFQTFYR
ncbi:uncharacterized protein LOC125543925 [Triticum urartu]|uniref:uncharacterized protein LOC125543925 n=1 Tax=Triticum urartu TaxID=4572 RepID=UPI002042F3AD|nr:uncharacterized protein LOC125543925 [Triticum urartu]